MKMGDRVTLYTLE